MPQLIAMVIVVVGAMIYMFQTFGGTGDKIEGVAQKTSAITEISNIKNGLSLAALAEHIVESEVAGKDAKKDLSGLADLSYFPEQINAQIIDNQAIDDNLYAAISFGGIKDRTDATSILKNDMNIKIVIKKNARPGIFVDFSNGSLADNAAFLEAQIANDLKNVATIVRKATDASTNVFLAAGDNPDTKKVAETDYLAPNTAAGTGTLQDGKFIIFFNDFSSSMLVR